MKLFLSGNIKDYILKNIDQVRIFEYYGNKYGNGLSIHDINKSIIINSYLVRNPLRNDPNPSMSFYKEMKNGEFKVIATDFGNSFYSGDCFHFAGIALKLNSNNPKHFIKICKHIIENVTNQISISTQSLPVTYRENQEVLIDIGIRNWNNKDFRYWFSYGITKERIESNIIPIQTFELMINGESRLRYYYTYNDPCYAYYLGNMKNIERYKLYFPFRKKNPRFITNNTLSIDDIKYMKPCETVIFIKSIKDRILLSQILNELYIISIQVIAISSENSRFSKDELNIINKFYKYKYSLFDNDKTGLDNMIWYKQEYGIMPLYLINGIRNISPEIIPTQLINDDVIIHKDIPKDLSDISKRLGYNSAYKIVENLLLKQLI